MHKKVLLIMVVSIMLFFAVSAENTCVWEGWWHADTWGNIHFQSTPSETTATFDGYGKFGAGNFEGSIMNDGEGLPCVFKGTWTEPKTGKSGKIELTMSVYDQWITGSYTHASDTSETWYVFPLTKPGYIG